MDEEIMQQIFDELLSSLEPLETQCAALLQLVKDKGIATDDDLAPYLETAGNASEIRGRAARLRMSSLILSATKPAEKPAESAGTQQAGGGAGQAAPEKSGGAEPVAAESVESSSRESDDRSAQPQPSDAKSFDSKPSNASSAGAGREPITDENQKKTAEKKEAA